MAVADHDFLFLHLKLEFERRQDGWFSCMHLEHLISDWFGPFATKKLAAEKWQEKLVALAQQKGAKG